MEEEEEEGWKPAGGSHTVSHTPGVTVLKIIPTISWWEKSVTLWPLTEMTISFFFKPAFSAGPPAREREREREKVRGL